MTRIKVTVTGTLPVEGHGPGESFTVDGNDRRLRMWERGGNVTRHAPVKKAAKKKTGSK